MYPEKYPIIIDKPEFDTIEIFAIHDLHYGNECFDSSKFNRLTKMILDKPNAFVVFVGDMMENAIPGSKSDIFTQTATPREQQEFVEATFKQFADRTLAIVDGNHEFNRSTRAAGLYPLYSAACIAKIDHLYRSAFAVLDIGFGNVGGRMSRAVGLITHRAKDMKSFASVDATEGFDFMFCGHDHDPHDHPRAHIFYDRQRKEVQQRSVEQIDNGSFLAFGGYGARGGYRPLSEKMYRIVFTALKDRQKSVETVGFYP